MYMQQRNRTSSSTQRTSEPASSKSRRSCPVASSKPIIDTSKSSYRKLPADSCSLPHIEITTTCGIFERIQCLFPIIWLRSFRFNHIGLLCLLVAALSFAPNVAAQQRPRDGCALGYNIPYPTPVVNIAGVSVSATEYLNNMACSFIVKLPSSNPPAFDSILVFSQFQTELNYDFVEVYNGCDPSRSRSGNTTIPAITSAPAATITAAPATTSAPAATNSAAPPCSLVSDFPFRLFRKSGFFRFVFFGSANK
jgi:hypothetical protein